MPKTMLAKVELDALLGYPLSTSLWRFTDSQVHTYRQKSVATFHNHSRFAKCFKTHTLIRMIDSENCNPKAMYYRHKDKIVDILSKKLDK